MYRVYIVDDDRNCLKAFGFLLESIGWEVQTFPGGRQVLDQTWDEPDCMLLDLRMPGISGVDTLKELIRRGHSFPVIGMSAWSDFKDLFLQAGAVAFLEKPFPDMKLIDTIRQVIAQTTETRVIVEQIEPHGEWEAWFADQPDLRCSGRLAVRALNRLLRTHPTMVPRPCGIRPDDSRLTLDHHEYLLFRRRQRPQTCSDCRGTGEYVGFTAKKPCPTCGGLGKL